MKQMAWCDSDAAGRTLYDLGRLCFTALRFASPEQRRSKGTQDERHPRTRARVRGQSRPARAEPATRGR